MHDSNSLDKLSNDLKRWAKFVREPARGAPFPVHPSSDPSTPWSSDHVSDHYYEVLTPDRQGHGSIWIFCWKSPVKLSGNISKRTKLFPLPVKGQDVSSIRGILGRREPLAGAFCGALDFSEFQQFLGRVSGFAGIVSLNLALSCWQWNSKNTTFSSNKKSPPFSFSREPLKNARLDV